MACHAEQSGTLWHRPFPYSTSPPWRTNSNGGPVDRQLVVVVYSNIFRRHFRLLFFFCQPNCRLTFNFSSSFCFPAKDKLENVCWRRCHFLFSFHLFYLRPSVRSFVRPSLSFFFFLSRSGDKYSSAGRQWQNWRLGPLFLPALVVSCRVVRERMKKYDRNGCWPIVRPPTRARLLHDDQQHWVVWLAGGSWLVTGQLIGWTWWLVWSYRQKKKT